MQTNLTKDWIHYLKNNQIVALRSDPDSGKLNYKRQVTTSDVVDFLQIKTDFDDNAINKAIDAVSNKSSGKIEPPAQLGSNNDREQQPNRPSAPQQKKYNTDDATDVEPRYGPRPALQAPKTTPSLTTTNNSNPSQPAKKQHTGGKKPGVLSQTPNAIRKRQARSNRKAGLNEDFVDNPGEELSEKDVEEIFRLLTHSQNRKQASAQNSTQKVRNQEIRKLKSVISGSMTTEQRKQLWDILQGTVTEGYANKNDTEQIFNYLNKSKPKIDIGDLQKAWAKAGYPSDTDEIAAILQKYGFADSDIEKAFVNVLGQDYNDTDADNTEPDDHGKSDIIIKIADYIKRAGLLKEILAYMQEHFKKELAAGPKQGMISRAVNFGKNLLKRKATVEDIRQIFTNIVQEERRALPAILRANEQQQLGRNRK